MIAKLGGREGIALFHPQKMPARTYHFRQFRIKGSFKASLSQLRIMHIEGDAMAPTLPDGDPSSST